MGNRRNRKKCSVALWGSGQNIQAVVHLGGAAGGKQGDPRDKGNVRQEWPWQLKGVTWILQNDTTLTRKHILDSKYGNLNLDF